MEPVKRRSDEDATVASCEDEVHDFLLDAFRLGPWGRTQGVKHVKAMRNRSRAHERHPFLELRDRGADRFAPDEMLFGWQRRDREG